MNFSAASPTFSFLALGRLVIAGISAGHPRTGQTRGGHILRALWQGLGGLLLITTLAIPASCAATQSAFYVAQAGNDANPGTADQPFATIARLQSMMEADGVKTGFIGAGTYALAATENFSNADNGFSFEAVPGTKPVIESANASVGSLWLMSDVSGMTIQGLTFTGGTQAAVLLQGSSGNAIVANLFTSTTEGLRLLGGSSNNAVSGNVLTNSAASAIECQDASNGNVFDSNLIDGTGAVGTAGGGIYCHGVSNTVISHNEVENTAGIGIGIEDFTAGQTTNSDNTITGNIVLDSNTSQQSTDSGSIYLLGRSANDTATTVSDNFVDGTGQQPGNRNTPFHTLGIYLDDLTSGVQLVGNILRDVGIDCVQIHGGENVSVTNNICDIGSGQAAFVLFQAAPANTNPPFGMTNDVVEHNILWSDSNSLPITYDYIDGGSPIISDNLYQNTQGQPMTTSSPTQDTAPVIGAAEFADEAQAEYQLGPNSLAPQVGFKRIDQSLMGLHPTTAHWY